MTKNHHLSEVTGLSKSQRRLLTLAGRQTTVDRRKGHENLFDGLVHLGQLTSAGEITQAGRLTLETIQYHSKPKKEQSDVEDV